MITETALRACPLAIAFLTSRKKSYSYCQKHHQKKFFRQKILFDDAVGYIEASLNMKRRAERLCFSRARKLLLIYLLNRFEQCLPNSLRRRTSEIRFWIG
jgi:hypothetical protein